MMCIYNSSKKTYDDRKNRAEEKKMNVFYLVTIILTLSMQNVAKKGYTQKNSGGVYLFSVLTCLSAALFFVVTSGGFQWETGIAPYALAFATAYCITTVFSVIAIDCGSLSLTNLMISYSLMIPALYGVFFLDEALSKGFYPGIVLLVISLFLINQQGEKTTVSFKWIIYVLFATVGNGMCSVFQKMQQVQFEGAYKNELMIVALVSAGGIIVTYIISKFVYKETLTKKQFAGFVLGIASVIFLNV